MRSVGTAPFVPVSPLATVRATDFAGIPPPRHTTSRPGEIVFQPHGRGFGLPCPDAGYALLLAHLSEEDLVLAPDEDREDARWSIATIAMHRAGELRRAPHIGDIHFACTLLAYDRTDASDFAHWRSNRLRGIAQDTALRQWLADSITVELTEHLSPDAAERWRRALTLQPE
jgi:hypothetical protein